MNNCTNSAIRDMLPDLEHAKLSTHVRQTVEEHLAGCESCREELRVIRTVRTATVFAPSINVDRVVRQLPPYRMPVPGKEAPARARVAQWLVAATVGVLLIVGGTLLKNRQESESPNRVGTAPLDSQTMIAESAPPVPDIGRVLSQPAHTPALALVADVQELSDGNLQQLMSELDDFDALPNSEPEPVFAVDTSEGR